MRDMLQTLSRWLVVLGVLGFGFILFVMAALLIEAPVLPDFSPYFAIAMACVGSVVLGLGIFLYLDMTRK